MSRAEFGIGVKNAALAMGVLIAIAGIAANIFGVSGPIADAGLDALVIGSFIWLIGSLLGAGISSGHVRTRTPAIIFACSIMIFFVRSCAPPPVLWGTALNPDPDPKHNVEENERITNTLIRQFPIGSPARNLQAALLLEGFQIGSPQGTEKWWDPSKGVQHQAEYHWGSNPFCDAEVSVIWAEDQSGRLTQLEGDDAIVCL